ncbi:MAG: bL17 family ribosomal protein [Christensenellales bacterium]|jgi:large subunit ribosomal protein L17|nr:50S ribosomal protein L17 [Christensenellaceae bacterium]
MAQRKLGRPADQRKALLRNQVTALLWHGRIETTLHRAKEVRRMAERLVTLAVREYDNTVQATKEYHNEKGQIVKIEVTNDLPSKLHARRMIMSYVYDVKEPKLKGESKSDYKERTQDIKYPLVEKLFREYGPKYRKRNEEKNSAGGYTRIYRLGPRRGDAAEMVIIEMV